MSIAAIDNSAGILNKPQEGVVQTLISSPNVNGQVAVIAYEFWIQRGCPMGSPDDDWFRAEEKIANRKVMTAAVG